MSTAQTASAATPILNFATVAESKKPRPRLYDRVAAHPDVSLIETCVSYASAIGSTSEATFKVDPTGNNDFAAMVATKSRNRADRLLAQITATAPRTMDGLRAKAAVMEVMLADCDLGALEPEHYSFLNSVARNVVELQRASQETGQSATVISGAA